MLVVWDEQLVLTCGDYNLCNPTLFLVFKSFNNTFSVSYDMPNIVLGFTF